MIKTHTCPTCGYEAVWVLRISTSNLTLCENCLPKFSNKYSHVYSFRLRKEVHHETHKLTVKQVKSQVQSLQDRASSCVSGTDRNRKSIAVRAKEGAGRC